MHCRIQLTNFNAFLQWYIRCSAYKRCYSLANKENYVKHAGEGTPTI